MEVRILEKYTGYKQPDERWITVHETGNENNGADAEMHHRYLLNRLNDGKISPFWHVTVDEDEAIQHAPFDLSARAAGDGRHGPGNATSIHFEVCKNRDGDYEMAKDRCAMEIAKLISTEPDHYSLKRVVQHNYWKSHKYPYGKNCPSGMRAGGGKGWKKFIETIERYLEKDYAGRWSEKDIDYCLEHSLLEGHSDGTFKPTDKLTREEFASWLARMHRGGKL